MLILIRSSTRHKVNLLLRLLVIVALVALILFQLSGLFKGYTFSSGEWLKEDNPSGNPMRVEKVNKDKKNKDVKTDNKNIKTDKKDFFYREP